MIFRNYQKTFATIGIVAIMIPVFFLAKPQKANALVPVIDAATIAAVEEAAAAQIVAIEAAQAAQEISDWDLFGPSAVPMSAGDDLRQLRMKEVGVGTGPASFSWDSLAYAIAGTVLKSITNSIVTWIKSGVQGQPGFIKDPEAFFTDAADQATGRFMKAFLSPEIYNAICQPFRLGLLISLKRTNLYVERMRCTLNTVLANAKNGVDFGVGIRNGNWGDWMSVTLNPQNNPSGALLTSLFELDTRQANARDTAKTESIFNAGFLSMKKCTLTVEDDWTGQQSCIRYETTSPGKWVSDTLTQATGIDMQRLAVADEINEILAALISQLLTGILK